MYKFVRENSIYGYILDEKKNCMVVLCTTKRPDLEFEGLQELVDKANEHEQIKNTTIKAIEKQMPKKITYEGFCPNCKYQYPMYPPSLEKYCSNCGQKLDWLIDQ